METLSANFVILAELVILLVAIGFGVQQIRSVNKLQRETAAREENERRDDAASGDRGES